MILNLFVYYLYFSAMLNGFIEILFRLLIFYFA